MVQHQTGNESDLHVLAPREAQSNKLIHTCKLGSHDLIGKRAGGVLAGTVSARSLASRRKCDRLLRRVGIESRYSGRLFT